MDSHQIGDRSTNLWTQTWGRKKHGHFLWPMGLRLSTCVASSEVEKIQECISYSAILHYTDLRKRQSFPNSVRPTIFNFYYLVSRSLINEIPVKEATQLATTCCHKWYSEKKSCKLLMVTQTHMRKINGKNLIFLFSESGRRQSFTHNIDCHTLQKLWNVPLPNTLYACQWHHSRRARDHMRRLRPYSGSVYQRIVVAVNMAGVNENDSFRMTALHFAWITQTRK